MRVRNNNRSSHKQEKQRIGRAERLSYSPTYVYKGAPEKQAVIVGVMTDMEMRLIMGHMPLTVRPRSIKRI